MAAYFVCHLMNIEGKSTKEPITVAQLLDPIRGTNKNQRIEDEAVIEEEFRHILEKEGVK
jgi:hypothetical protein